MDKELETLLESLQEGEESPVMDLSSDIYYARFSLSEEQNTRPGVLCTIEGIGMGPFGEENRNVRDYPVEVATEGILGSSYVKEMMKYKTLLGEPHHPKDRNEVWCDMVSHSIVDMWMSPDNKYLMIRVDILDTPSGRILKTLIDYGCILGISARASGKTRKVKGRLRVVPEAYKFKTFDVVTNPGFEDARLNRVDEEVNENNSLKEGLEKLTESTDLATLKSVRQLIEYCEDSDIKELLPYVESRLEMADNSGNFDSDTNGLEELVEEITQELSEARLREVEQKNTISNLLSQVAFLQSLDKGKSVNDPQEVLTEDIVNLKRTLEMKEESLRQAHKDNEELLYKLEESSNEIEELKLELVDLRESRRVATASIKKYRELNEELQSQIESLSEETIVESVEEDLKVEVPTVRRKKVGIGSLFEKATEVQLNEEVEPVNPNRVKLIKNLGGK